MAVLTLAQLEAVFQQTTCALTGYAGPQVRITYPGKSQPAWRIDENVIFITVVQVSNPYDVQRNIRFVPINLTDTRKEIQYTRVMEVLWTCYGPGAFDIVDLIRTQILQPENRRLLTAASIAPLTDIPSPTRVPYNFSAQWWERSDLKGYFNVDTLRTTEIPFLESAGIRIYDDNGLQRTIDIQEPEE